ncbi:hypothetical protein BGZ67_002836 [Mortierella alpina]|nr:hypothetical protein BGZ67_002836 [Mortierella alpina]
MHIASGIIAAFFLAAGVSAQFAGANYDRKHKTWEIPNGLRLSPCITTCREGQVCRMHDFASNIRACGGQSDWQFCRGFCVYKGDFTDEEAMKPKP